MPPVKWTTVTRMMGTMDLRYSAFPEDRAGVGASVQSKRLGEWPDFAPPKTSEVFGDFGSLAGKFPLAARLTTNRRRLPDKHF